MKIIQNTTKNRPLIIAIIDDDKFYTAGLVMALSIYLKNKNREAKFYFSPREGKTTDIIFQAIRCGACITPRYSFPKGDDHQQIYFSIVNRNDAHLRHLYRDEKQNYILYRHQSVSSLFQHIENSLFSQPQLSEMTQRAPNRVLTLREQEVLHHLNQGKTPASVANCMGIKEKTISSHKRAAMKKLNFRRSNELFHWMLQGGLSRHPPRKEH